MTPDIEHLEKVCAEATGPRMIGEFSCQGCPALVTEQWREPSGDGETYDNGTYAACMATGKRRDMGEAYWSPRHRVPAWCPAPAPTSYASLLAERRVLIEERDEARKNLAEAREQFLCLIADAKRWDEDVDGEYHTDSPVPTVTICYFAEFAESSVRDLVEALGIKVRFDEPVGDAIARRLEEDHASWLASREAGTV